MSAQVYSVPGQTDGREKAFLELTIIYLPSKLSLTCGGNVKFIKVHHSIPTLPGAIGNTLSIFKILSSWPNWRGEEGLFWKVQEGGRIVRLPPRAPVVIKDEKVCLFMKFKTITPLLCCLSDLLTNKHCRAGSSMTNLWTDSKIFQKYRFLQSARQRPNNYLKRSKEKVLGNMMLSHWPCFTWEFFMMWFHKILKLIFQKQPSWPRNICTERWRKPPIFTAFWEVFFYLKNNDSVELV